jgi:hypothetical protein
MLSIALGAWLVHAPAPAVRRVEFVFVLFGGDPAGATPRPNLTHSYGEDLPAIAAQWIAGLNHVYATTSYGHQQAARSAVYGYLTLPLDAPLPGTDCDQGKVVTAASALIPAPAPGASRWFYPPSNVRCGNADGSFPGGFTDHEFGHNIGFMHEHNLRQNGSSFSTEEYGYRSMMGGQGINLGAEMKDRAPGGSWFDGTYSIASVTAPEAQDVVLTAYDEMTPGIKALKVLVPIASPRASGPVPVCFVEFRPGRQGGPNEVLVHNTSNSLLDLDPGPGDKWSLDPGDVKCWTSPTVCLSNLGYGRGPTARIRVTFDTPPPTAGSGPRTPR